MKDVRQRLKSSSFPLNGLFQEGQLCRYGLDCRVCGATVLFATPGVNQTEKPLRLVGYTVDGTKYRVATSPYDLTAEQIAFIYKLRWDIEKFFAWRKRHLRVYHLIARSQYGLMVQTLSGLITYLLLAIYFREQHNKKVSIKRARELRIKIQNETRIANNNIVRSAAISTNTLLSVLTFILWLWQAN